MAGAGNRPLSLFTHGAKYFGAGNLGSFGSFVKTFYIEISYMKRLDSIARFAKMPEFLWDGPLRSG